MATPKNQTSTTKREDPRAKLREARKRRLRLIAGDRPTSVKVFAANETLREVLRHPSGGLRFRDDISQGVEWPNDSFTARRIADGSVRTDGPGSGDAPPDDETLNARQQAQARKPEGEGKEPPTPPKSSHQRHESQQPGENESQQLDENQSPQPDAAA
jgi:hypothetical protein